MKRLRYDLEEHGLLLEWTEELLDAVDDMPIRERPPATVLALLLDSNPDVQWEVLRHLVGEEGKVILQTSKQLAHAMRHAYHRAFWIAYDRSLKRYLAWDPWYALPGKQEPTDLVDPLYQLLHPRHGLSLVWFVRLEHDHFPELTSENKENLLTVAEQQSMDGTFKWLLRLSDKRPVYLQGSFWARRLPPGTRLSFWSLWMEMLEQYRAIVDQGDFMDREDDASLHTDAQMHSIFSILHAVWHDTRPDECAVWLLFDRHALGHVVSGIASRAPLTHAFLTRIAKKRGLDLDAMIHMEDEVPWDNFWWKVERKHANEYGGFLLMLIEKTQPEEPRQTLENFLSPTLRLWFLAYDYWEESNEQTLFAERLKALPFESGEPQHSRTIEDDVLRPLSKFSPRMLYTIMKQWRGEWGLPYYHAVREELAQRLLASMDMEEIKELGGLIESGRTRIGYVAQVESILIHLPSTRPTRRLLKILGEKGLALSPAEVDKFYNIDARDGRPILFLLE